MTKIFEEYPLLNNDKLILKRLTLEDISPLEALKADKAVYRYEPSFLPECLESSRDFIQKTCDQLFKDHSNIILGIYNRADMHFMGLAELYDYVESRQKISLGVRLSQNYWHQGYGSQVIALLKEYCLKTVGLKRLTAHIRIENIGSQKVFIKNGFVLRREAHLEDWGLTQPILAYKYVIYPESE